LGLKGISIGFFALYAAYAVGMYWIVRYLTGFRWSAASQKLMLLLLPLVIAVFLAGRSLPLWPATAFGVAISLTASVLSLRGLVQRIGTEHRIIRMACRVPGMRWACGA
jgi:PST family polysaccharide transporter